MALACDDWRQKNKLNDLSPQEWIKFQKSWFVHNPPPRPKGVLCHPAKFPETMIEEFIRFFTKAGQIVLDPMAGTGSAIIAAARAGRIGIGIELQERYAAIAREWLAAEQKRLGLPTAASCRIITADARQLRRLKLPAVDYCITSPPYWDMLRRNGFETQKKRAAAALDVYYSEDPADLGNIADYQLFLRELLRIYRQVARLLRPGAYMTVIVKNVKKGGKMFPLAWDLAQAISRFLQLKDEKIWCQDNQTLAPYGMGTRGSPTQCIIIA